MGGHGFAEGRPCQSPNERLRIAALNGGVDQADRRRGRWCRDAPMFVAARKLALSTICSKPWSRPWNSHPFESAAVAKYNILERLRFASSMRPRPPTADAPHRQHVPHLAGRRHVQWSRLSA